MRPIIISLPIADRQASFRFYGDGLGFEAIGEPASDGVPEPLQFALNDGLHLMLVPRTGFGWVIGDHEVAEPGEQRMHPEPRRRRRRDDRARPPGRRADRQRAAAPAVGRRRIGCRR